MNSSPTYSSQSAPPPRSLFVGPTHFWRGKERRKGYRRLTSILRKGHTEPLELFFALHFLGAGLVWWFSAPDKVIPNSQLIGTGLAATGICGLLGLWLRSTAVRCIFAMMGGWLRGYLMTFYLINDWHDPVWYAHSLGAAGCGWLFVRVFCHHWSKRTQQSIIEQRGITEGFTETKTETG